MDTSKIIKGVVSNGRYTVTAPIVKEDYGLYLKIEGVELPSTYEVDFSNSENSGSSVTMIGNADGVLIPHQFIDTGKDVFAFLYHVGEDFGRTVYKFRIPNKVRPDRTNEQPTPEEQSTIDQAISALNEAVAQTAQDVIDADASAQSASADADRAEEARTDAQNYATQAEQARDDAQTYANNASASATASANLASASAQIKADVEELVDDAQGYAESASQSATASANSATTAQGYAQSASSSAQSASDYASQAQTSTNTASAKAQDASQSATTASQKATESAQSASQALGYKTDAESARDEAVTAKNAVQGSVDQIAQNTEDVSDLKEDLTQLQDNLYYPQETLYDGDISASVVFYKQKPRFELKQGNKVLFKTSIPQNDVYLVLSFMKEGDSSYYQQTTLRDANETSVITLADDYEKIAVYNARTSSVSGAVILCIYNDNAITEAVELLQSEIEETKKEIGQKYIFENVQYRSGYAFVQGNISLISGDVLNVVINKDTSTKRIGNYIIYGSALENPASASDFSTLGNTNKTATSFDIGSTIKTVRIVATLSESEQFEMSVCVYKETDDMFSYLRTELQKRPKTFSVIGDSWSAYKGYTNPSTNKGWYPSWETHVEGSDNNVETPDQMWWNILSLNNHISMLENNSYSGSPISYDGYGTGTDDAKAYALVTRIKNMIDSDILFIEGGTNDSNVGATLGEYKYSKWTDADLVQFRPALCCMLDYAKNRHPLSEIYFLINGSIASDYKDSIIEVCNHYGITYIILEGIDRQNGHPSIAGQNTIANIVSKAIIR